MSIADLLRLAADSERRWKLMDDAAEKEVADFEEKLRRKIDRAYQRRLAGDKGISLDDFRKQRETQS